MPAGLPRPPCSVSSAPAPSTEVDALPASGSHCTATSLPPWAPGTEPSVHLHTNSMLRRVRAGLAGQQIQAVSAAFSQEGGRGPTKPAVCVQRPGLAAGLTCPGPSSHPQILNIPRKPSMPACSRLGPWRGGSLCAGAGVPFFKRLPSKNLTKEISENSRKE